MAGARMTVAGHRLSLPSLDFTAALTLALVAAFLGGASRNARVSLLFVELASLPVAAIAVRGMLTGERRRLGVWPLIAIVGMLVIPLV